MTPISPRVSEASMKPIVERRKTVVELVGAMFRRATKPRREPINKPNPKGAQVSPYLLAARAQEEAFLATLEAYRRMKGPSERAREPQRPSEERP